MQLALEDNEAQVRRNAAFAVGVLVENTDQDVSPYYIELLQKLGVYFNVAPTATLAELNARDNAAGAVSRMILKNTAAVPVQDVRPVRLTLDDVQLTCCTLDTLLGSAYFDRVVAIEERLRREPTHIPCHHPLVQHDVAGDGAIPGHAVACLCLGP